MLDGGAFVDGVDAMRGIDEGSVINVFFDLPGAAGYIDSILGTTTADGGIVTVGFNEATLIGRITIVPAPASGALLAFGFAGVTRRRRRPA